jgi:predicted PurR-regulated permease PerM
VLLVLAFFAGMGWFFSQAIASQIDQLSQQLPAAVAKVESIIGQSSVGKIITEHLSPTSIKQSPLTMLQNFFGVATNAAEVVGALVVTTFLGIYFAAEANLHISGLVRLVPRVRRALRRNPARDRERDLVLDAGSPRIDDVTRLSGRDGPVDNWCPAACGTGVSGRHIDLCPVYRRIVSAIPSLMLAVSVNLELAIYVVLLYLAVHLIEGYILVPLVQRRVLHLPPALTLSAQIILGVLAGFLGLLLATPLVAAALVVIRMVYVEDVLGDRTTTEPAPFKDPAP